MSNPAVTTPSTTTTAPPVTTPATVVSNSVDLHVGITTCDFFDSSRTVKNYRTGKITQGRALPTEVRYPTLAPGNGQIPGAAPAVSAGPFPMIIFGHGYKLMPGSYKALLDAWVRAGFVVAAPIFPDTNKEAVAKMGGTPRAEDDIVHQPGDIEYVATQLIDASKQYSSLCPVVNGLINSSELALAGQSDGATTVAGLAYDTNYDAGIIHYDAVAALSGQQFGAFSSQGPDPYVATASSPALLVVQSRTDVCNPPQYSAALYNAVSVQNKWFLELMNDDHLPPYTGSDPVAFGIVAKVTTAFFKAMLEGTSTNAIVAAGRTDPNVAWLTSGPNAPPLPTLSMNIGQCYVDQ